MLSWSHLLKRSLPIFSGEVCLYLSCFLCSVCHHIPHPPMLSSLCPQPPQRPDLLPLEAEERSFCLPPAVLSWCHAGRGKSILTSITSEHVGGLNSLQKQIYHLICLCAKWIYNKIMKMLYVGLHLLLRKQAYVNQCNKLNKCLNWTTGNCYFWFDKKTCQNFFSLILKWE